ncbi:MAG: exo-alpha-sialidase [Clostridia bacterium]|nr:exo-alpha-sialidase [Clostridia bacterium]
MRLCHTTRVETSYYRWKVLKALLAEGAEIPEAGEYLLYRIPGLVEAPNGDLLAYCECRTGGDWSAIDVCMRRSADGGKTWSERVLLASGQGRMTTNNPVMIVDGERIHLLYCQSYKRLYHRVSDDNGYTWSAPVELTEQVEDSTDFFWSCLAPGPGHGIRTSGGRLIVPIWFACNRLDIYAHAPSVVCILFSDDGGKTWRVSKPLTGEGIPDPNESTLAELPDGRLLMNIRNVNGSMLRAVAISEDGGESFSPMTLDPSLPDPICEGSLCRAGDGLLFVNCNSQIKEERDRLTVRYRIGENAPWDSLEICATGGYSDVCYSEKAGRAYVLYECENYLYMNLAEVEL